MKLSYIRLNLRVFCSGLCFLVFSSYVNGLFAYEQNTHREMSQMAYNRSVLNLDSSLLDNLGIDADILFFNSSFDERNISQLILDGAEFEDAKDSIEVGEVGGENLRMKHHFYNPQDSGKSFNWLLYGPDATIKSFKTYSSADWALEEIIYPSDSGEEPIGEIRAQRFSFSDANDSFRKAITLQYEHDRKRFWGHTFQTLGHVIHHIQDMAQPQHTRNDAHTPINHSARKYYELYTEKKRIDPKRGLNYSGYPDIDLETFNTSRLFWDDESAIKGIGLAEFSSINFVSAGTNFHSDALSGDIIANLRTHPDFNFPEVSNVEYMTKSIEDNDLLGPQGPDQPLHGSIKFIGSYVSDAYKIEESKINPRTSTYSIFNSELQFYQHESFHSLNRFNYDSAHEFLIPRAVAYSAGMIDYFFRGRIEARVTDDRDGIEITNISNGGIASSTGPYAFKSGRSFQVQYETNTGELKYLFGLSNQTLMSNLEINGTHTITGFSDALRRVANQLGEDEKIIVWFDGDIGNERGIAVTTLPLPNVWLWVNSNFFDFEPPLLENHIQESSTLIQIALFEDKWVEAGPQFDAVRQDIINGITSSQTEARGWNTFVRDNLLETSVRLTTPDKIVRVIIPAMPGYEISANETISATIPSSAIATSSADLEAPQFTIEFTNLVCGWDKLLSRQAWYKSATEPQPWPVNPLGILHFSFGGQIDFSNADVVSSTPDEFTLEKVFDRWVVHAGISQDSGRKWYYSLHSTVDETGQDLIDNGLSGTLCVEYQ